MRDNPFKRKPQALSEIPEMTSIIATMTYIAMIMGFISSSTNVKYGPYATVSLGGQ